MKLTLDIPSSRTSFYLCYDYVPLIEVNETQVNLFSRSTLSPTTCISTLTDEEYPRFHRAAVIISMDDRYAHCFPELIEQV